MGIIGGIITSVIILVIALVIVEFIFNPHYLSSFKQSITSGVSGLVNNVQTASVKAVVATQSNKSIMYMAENSNNTIALYDIQYNKIIGFVDLNGTSPNNLATGPGNKLYVTGSYYNYHNPKDHGVIDIINTSSRELASIIPMVSVPVQIAISANGTYAYTLNDNNTESAIGLQNTSVLSSFPFTTTGAIYQIQNATAECTYSNSNSNTTVSCKGFSGYNQPISNWVVSILNQESYVTSNVTLQKNYSGSSFSDIYTLPLVTPNPQYQVPTYVATVLAYDNGQKVQQFKFSQLAYIENRNITGTPEGLIFSPTQNLLFVLANYGNCGDVSFGFQGECSVQSLFALNGSNINQTIWQITLSPDNTGTSHSPKQLVISPDGKTLYVVDSSIAVVNTTTMRQVKTLDFSATSLGMSPTGDYIYAISGGTFDDVAVINTSTESVVDSLNVGSGAGEALEDVAVTSNFTYIIKSAPLGNSNYYLVRIARANDSIVNNTGISGCPCEIIT